MTSTTTAPEEQDPRVLNRFMKIPMDSHFFTDKGYDTASTKDLALHSINAGAAYLYQCVRHNDRRLADSVAEYFAGVYDQQRAMIDSGSGDYSVYREFLPDAARERSDSTIANYLVLKGTINPRQSNIPIRLGADRDIETNPLDESNSEGKD
ncbi:MAG: hypothetical protein ABH864_00755 [archaeon]